MKTALKQMEQELEAIRQAGTWREERIQPGADPRRETEL